MEDYVRSILAELPSCLQGGSAATPAANHLFEVRDNVERLPLEQADEFHRIVMQLMYLAQRGRPDVRTAVSFLTTRVVSPDDNDWKKLGRTLKYLNSTVDMPLTLTADGSGIIRWWVDASFAVHEDMKSHTGAMMSLGKGAVYSTSMKQKFMTRSSTEAKVVGVHDVMPQVLWTRHFLLAQGLEVKDNVIYQDNMSAMLLEQNGRASSTKRTCHMNICYFFVKDRCAAGELRVEYCPMKDMHGDFGTKPLQGTLFRIHLDAYMNLDPTSKYHSDHRSVLEPDSKDSSSVVPEAKKKTYLEAAKDFPATSAQGVDQADPAP